MPSANSRMRRDGFVETASGSAGATVPGLSESTIAIPLMISAAVSTRRFSGAAAAVASRDQGDAGGGAAGAGAAGAPAAAAAGSALSSSSAFQTAQPTAIIGTVRNAPMMPSNWLP